MPQGLQLFKQNCTNGATNVTKKKKKKQSDSTRQQSMVTSKGSLSMSPIKIQD